MLREYARLEKKRLDAGLSLPELQRWTALDDALRKELKKQPHDARRSSRRVATLLSVHFKSQDEARHCLLTNVSRGGVFVYTETPAPIGTRLELEIKIDLPDSTISTIVVPAQVVSQNVAPDMSGTCKGMGCSFLDMDDDTRKQVDELYGRALVEAGAAEKPGEA